MCFKINGSLEIFSQSLHFWHMTKCLVPAIWSDIFQFGYMTQIFYKASKHRFDNDQEFKERAQQGVVRLQVSGYLGCQLVKSGKVFSSEQCIYL